MKKDLDKRFAKKSLNKIIFSKNIFFMTKFSLCSVVVFIVGRGILSPDAVYAYKPVAPFNNVCALTPERINEFLNCTLSKAVAENRKHILIDFQKQVRTKFTMLNCVPNILKKDKKKHT